MACLVDSPEGSTTVEWKVVVNSYDVYLIAYVDMYVYPLTVYQWKKTKQNTLDFSILIF